MRLYGSQIMVSIGLVTLDQHPILAYLQLDPHKIYMNAFSAEILENFSLEFFVINFLHH